MRFTSFRALGTVTALVLALALLIPNSLTMAKSAGFKGSDAEETTSFAQRYAAAWSSQNPDSVASFYSEEGRLVVNAGEAAVGREAIAEVARGFMKVFPDMVVTFDRLEPRGERMLFHWTLTGTNTGPGGTGASVSISGFEAWLMGDDGLIVDSAGSFDAEDYARQLASGDK